MAQPLARALGCWLLAVSLASSARAIERAPEEPPSIAAQVFAAKQRLAVHEARQEILRHRVRENPGAPLPAGLTLDREATLSPRTARALAAAHPGLPRLSDYGTNRRVNDPTLDLFADAAQNGPAVAGIGNHLVMAFNDGDGRDRSSPDDQMIGYAVSIDGGVTWADAGAPPQLPGHDGWQWKGSPVLAVNETTGEFFLAGLTYPDGATVLGATNGVAVVKGSFTGDVFAWGVPSLALYGLSTLETWDRPAMAIDPANGHVWVAGTRTTAASNEIAYSYSTDGLDTWLTRTKISSATDDNRCQGSRVAIGPNGEVYVVWKALGTFDRDFYRIRKSAGAGQPFGNEVTAGFVNSNYGSGPPGSNRGSGNSDPRLAVDRTMGPHRGRVYLAWNETVDYFTTDLNSPSTGNISETEGTGAFGQNDNATRARVFAVGNTVRGYVGDLFNDIDWYRFTANQGQTCVFYVDSVSVTLDFEFRLFCSDSTTRLAFSSLGKGARNLIVWTAPANGTYYLKIEPRPNTSDLGTQRYRIHTAFHVNPGTDRARDMRDVFVASSADGVTWPNTGPGAPKRVNDDVPWFDDALPEIAITGDSRLFCTWFDWRDSDPARCGGQSGLYLFRSDDAGATWFNLGTVTDALSDWSFTSTNLEPNQGDYLALYANGTGVYPAWGDGRDGNPNVYTVPIDIATPTLASLASARVEPDRVTLDWLALEHANRDAVLERREIGDGWSAISEARVDGEGRVRFVDATVTPGRRYAYRLAFGRGGGDFEYSSEAVIDVPSGLALTLGTPRPNPAVGELWLSVTLPAAGPATLTLVDVAGRVVRSRDLGALGAGAHRVNFTGGELPAGVYVAVLRQGGRTVTTRASVVR